MSRNQFDGDTTLARFLIGALLVGICLVAGVFAVLSAYLWNSSSVEVGQPLLASTDGDVSKEDFQGSQLAIDSVGSRDGSGLLGREQASPTLTDNPPTPLLVSVAPIEVVSRPHEHQFYGISRAVNRAVLSFTIGGRLEERLVDVGDWVEEGDEIARLDQRPFRIARDAADASREGLQARLEQLRRDRNRLERLVAASAGVQEELEQVTTAEATLLASLDAAEAQLQGARQQIREATLLAPFAGTVTAVFLQPGEFAPPGAPILSLNGGGIEVEVQVPESFLSALSECQSIAVHFPLADIRDVAGSVRTVAQSASGVAQLFAVVVAIDTDESVLPGMTAEVVFSLSAHPAQVVPVGAIVDPVGGDAAVFIVADGEARRVSVRIGDLLNGRVCIEGDIPTDARVIIGGQDRVSPGQVVEVRP